MKTTSPDGLVPRPELAAQRPEARLVVRPAAGEVDVASRQLTSPLDNLHQLSSVTLSQSPKHTTYFKSYYL